MYDRDDLVVTALPEGGSCYEGGYRCRPDFFLLLRKILGASWPPTEGITVDTVPDCLVILIAAADRGLLDI
jgi:hypothetical protein